MLNILNLLFKLVLVIRNEKQIQENKISIVFYLKTSFWVDFIPIFTQKQIFRNVSSGHMNWHLLLVLCCDVQRTFFNKFYRFPDTIFFKLKHANRIRNFFFKCDMS